MPSLEYLNSLLHPRKAQFFAPDVVIDAARAAMLQRHRHVGLAPEPAPSDVADVYGVSNLWNDMPNANGI